MTSIDCELAESEACDRDVEIPPVDGKPDFCWLWLVSEPEDEDKDTKGPWLDAVEGPTLLSDNDDDWVIANDVCVLALIKLLVIG